MKTTEEMHQKYYDKLFEQTGLTPEVYITFIGLLFSCFFASIGACFITWLIVDKGILE